MVFTVFGTSMVYIRRYLVFGRYRFFGIYSIKVDYYCNDQRTDCFFAFQLDINRQREETIFEENTEMRWNEEAECEKKRGGEEIEKEMSPSHR